jgi:competence protein ComEC
VLGGALGVVVGAALGQLLEIRAALVVALAAAAILFGFGRRLAVIGVLMILGVLSGHAGVVADGRMLAAELPAGRVEMTVLAVSDPRPGYRDPYVLVRPVQLGADPWKGPLLLAAGPDIQQMVAGKRYSAFGLVQPIAGRARGRPYAGTVELRDVAYVGSSLTNLAANGVRSRILGSLESFSSRQGAALLAGFLIGETSGIDPVHLDELRASGLTHFVAVSGSNVAIFLLMWWAITAPFVQSPRRRAALGLVGLALFVVITRAEPSVVRAGVMAAVVLVGRAIGLPVNAWRALGLAVIGLLLFDGRLVTSVGFQLSAAATAGVLYGARMLEGKGPRLIMLGLGTSLAAQVAVAPLLLWHFGEVPLMSPITNLLAAPLVSASTMLGGVGTLANIAPITRLGVGAAETVLSVAGAAAGLPAVGWWGALGLLGLALLARIRMVRPLLVTGSVVWLALLLAGPADVSGPAVVFFDVGQGDSALVVGAGGETILFDSGPDPTLLAQKLRNYGVDRIDLVVLSHRHLDHVGGLLGVLGHIPVAEVWHVSRADEGAFGPVKRRIDELGIPRRSPEVGEVWRSNGLQLTVLGPQRHYANPNDESLVVAVDLGIHRILFAGDVEVIAQREMTSYGATIIKVPHQGAATSDAGWLRANRAAVAIVPVGPNDYGHPAPWVIDLLKELGSLVCRTDIEGDIRIDLLRRVKQC